MQLSAMTLTLFLLTQGNSSIDGLLLLLIRSLENTKNLNYINTSHKK